MSNNNIHRPVWTATGISSRQRRFHYRIRLRDAYPGEFRVHKAHEMRRRGETGQGEREGKTWKRTSDDGLKKSVEK